MGSGVITAALEADLLDEFTIHQAPILLGGGTPFFGDLPAKIQLRLVSVTEAPGSRTSPTPCASDGDPAGLL